MMIIQRIKYLILTAFVVLSGTTLLVPAVVNADFKGDACAGVNALQDSTSTTCSKTAGKTLNNTIRWVVNILSVVVGVAAVIMVIIGGFKFITSSGDSNNIASARNTILYAIIGLVIVVLAQVLVHFVLNKTAIAAGK
jgi:cytochrome bd-type quinol oxidase subunit 2